MPKERIPWWLWPNLLSLDAPIVAVVWLHLFARTWQVNYLPIGGYLGLGVSVWAIYVVDRLLDIRLCPAEDESLGLRHRFHARHRRAFLAGLAVAAGILLWVVFGVLPGYWPYLVQYLIPASILVAGFFLLVVAGRPGVGVPLGRNLVAGAAFAWGVAMAAHLWKPSQSAIELLLPLPSPELICFALLCTLNISAIHLWEHARRSGDREVDAGDEMSLTLPLLVLAGAALLFAYRDNPGGHTRPFFYAILISAALLQVLNRRRERYSIDVLRTLADAAMIAPLPLFAVLSAG